MQCAIFQCEILINTNNNNYHITYEKIYGSANTKYSFLICPHSDCFAGVKFTDYYCHIMAGGAGKS